MVVLDTHQMTNSSFECFCHHVKKPGLTTLENETESIPVNRCVQLPDMWVAIRDDLAPSWPTTWPPKHEWTQLTHPRGCRGAIPAEPGSSEWSLGHCKSFIVQPLTGTIFAWPWVRCLLLVPASLHVPSNTHHSLVAEPLLSWVYQNVSQDLLEDTSDAKPFMF